MSISVTFIKHQEETCDPEDEERTPGLIDGKQTRTQYTLKEVAAHDSWDDCWVIIYDRVYDITKFLELVGILTKNE